MIFCLKAKYMNLLESNARTFIDRFVFHGPISASVSGIPEAVEVVGDGENTSSPPERIVFPDGKTLIVYVTGHNGSTAQVQYKLWNSEVTIPDNYIRGREFELKEGETYDRDSSFTLTHQQVEDAK